MSQLLSPNPHQTVIDTLNILYDSENVIMLDWTI